MIDNRRIPARKTIAAAHLEGQVEAERFVEGTHKQIAVPLLNLTTTANPRATLATQLLFGEVFTVYEEIPDMGLSWGQAADGYVGYVASEGLLPEDGLPKKPITALSALVYAAPDLKAPQLGAYAFGCQVHVEAEEGDYARLGEGMFIPKPALLPRKSRDFVDIAEGFIGLPYLWGGRSSYGLDCSALVQISLNAVGKPAPRDSDMQADELGILWNDHANLKRGDLVFWNGHVGIMQTPETLLHANAHHMAVTSEPLQTAVSRIAAKGDGDITAVRRF